MPSALLASAGVVIVAIGVYFMLFRPPLLPEDFRYTQSSPENIRTIVPELALWLRYVFRVAGGYMVASGVLTIYVAMTSFELTPGPPRLSSP